VSQASSLFSLRAGPRLATIAPCPPSLITHDELTSRFTLHPCVFSMPRSVGIAYAEMVKETKEVSDLDKEIRELELEFARLRSKYPLEDVSASP
jgi:hypothetical protein